MESQQFKKMTWALFEGPIPAEIKTMLEEFGPVSVQAFEGSPMTTTVAMDTVEEVITSMEKLVKALDAHYYMKPIELQNTPKSKLMTLHEYLRQVYCIDFPTRQVYDDPR